MLGAEPATDIYKELRGKWAGWLSEQDRGGFRAHYTVQNFVGDGERRGCLGEVRRGGVGEGRRGWVDGVELWRYEGGWWVWRRGFAFGGEGEGGGMAKEEGGRDAVTGMGEGREDV